MSRKKPKLKLEQAPPEQPAEAKTPEQTPVAPPAPTQADVDAAYNELARGYVQAVLEIICMQGHPEVDSSKRTITTPGGGVYLLQLQHVMGPKIKCELKKADA